MKTVLRTKVIEPSILYYGTPVILLSTLNEDGTTNIAPISSSWALGNHIIIGVGNGGKSAENLQNRPECVINIPDDTLWENVERMAPYTGKEEIPQWKKDIGFRYAKDKLVLSGLSALPSDMVKPIRIAECPLQMEAVVKNIFTSHGETDFYIVETESVRVHAHEDITIGDRYINTDRWHPLIYNFRHYFGRGQKLGQTFRAEV